MDGVEGLAAQESQAGVKRSADEPAAVIPSQGTLSGSSADPAMIVVKCAEVFSHFFFSHLRFSFAPGGPAFDKQADHRVQRLGGPDASAASPAIRTWDSPSTQWSIQVR